MITLEESGRRIYLLGDTFAVRSQIKSCGGHWDPDRKAWWVGAAKKSDAESLARSAGNAPSAQADRGVPPEGKQTRVIGTATYKGHTYFVAWAGVTRKGAHAMKLVSRDASFAFWADMGHGPDAAQWKKEYREPMTIARILAFHEERRRAEKTGECPRCESMFLSGKWAPYGGSGDYDTCPVCGCTVQITY